MLMVLSAIGIGVAISLVYLYKNKYSIGYNSLRLYDKIDEFMENLVDTNSTTFCIENRDYFKEVSTIDEVLDNYNPESYPIFLEKKCIKRDTYYKYHLYENYNKDTDSIELEQMCVSPIIMCSLTVSNSKGVLHDQYDITKMVNSFVFSDCVLTLSNQDIYKKMWLMMFNNTFKSKNMYINIDNLDDIVLKWFIILDNGDMLDSENHILKIEGGKYIK